MTNLPAPANFSAGQDFVGAGANTFQQLLRFENEKK